MSEYFIEAFSSELNKEASSKITRAALARASRLGRRARAQARRGAGLKGVLKTSAPMGIASPRPAGPGPKPKLQPPKPVKPGFAGPPVPKPPAAKGPVGDFAPKTGPTKMASVTGKVIDTAKKVPVPSQLRDIANPLAQLALLTGGGYTAGRIHEKAKRRRKDRERRAAKGEKVAKDLTEAGREKIKKKNFALPAKGKQKKGPTGDVKPKGSYPMHDLAHARNALARVSQHGTPEEQAKVRRAVYAKYPGLKERKEEKSGTKMAAEASGAADLVKAIIADATKPAEKYTDTQEMGVDDPRFGGGPGLKNLGPKRAPKFTDKVNPTDMPGAFKGAEAKPPAGMTAADKKWWSGLSEDQKKQVKKNLAKSTGASFAGMLAGGAAAGLPAHLLARRLVRRGRVGPIGAGLITGVPTGVGIGVGGGLTATGMAARHRKKHPDIYWSPERAREEEKKAKKAKHGTGAPIVSKKIPQTTNAAFGAGCGMGKKAMLGALQKRSVL